MKNQILCTLLLLILCGCAPKISEHFEQNRYVKNYSLHIVNTDLQLYFKSPADITYTTDKKELQEIIRQQPFKLKDPVLVYGKTDDPPYELFVTISQNKVQQYPQDLIVFDTLIQKNRLQFIGRPRATNARKSLAIDLKQMFKSVELGPGYRKDISTVMDVVKKHENSNKFYAVLNEIQLFPTYDKQEEWTKFQMELTYASFLGNNTEYTAYLKALESRFKPNEAIANRIKKHVNTTDNAIDSIVSKAKNHRVVMINENHFFPNHRLLVSDVLEQLRDIGYRYLALEALASGQDSVLNQNNSYPTMETGFYTSEQQYANLIRKAKALGYEFIAYENTDPNKNRELGQAENLYNKTLKLNPERKVIVLAGIDHILEQPKAGGKKWMATQFKNLYNIDPLTISQTHLNSYRTLSNTDYSLIPSSHFENERLQAVHYLMLNNKRRGASNELGTFPYQNTTASTIQVALFYEHEILNNYDYHKKVPYFTTLLKAGDTYSLPISKTGKSYLYTFDKTGERLDKRLIDRDGGIK